MCRPEPSRSRRTWPLPILNGLTLVGTFAAAVVGCVATDDGAMPEDEALQDMGPHMSYCRPDDDVAFQRVEAAETSFHEFRGSRVVGGTLRQTHPGGPVTFQTGVDQSCPFLLSDPFNRRSHRLEEDFGLDRAWTRAPTCDPADGTPHLTARVRLRVVGFRIPARYVEEYDPRRILSGMEMARYRFSLDYDEVMEVLSGARVDCPMVSPPHPPPGWTTEPAP